MVESYDRQQEGRGMIEYPLSPPGPQDPPATRPPFNLTSMAVQIWMIQTWLATERTRKQTNQKKEPA